MTVYDFRSDTVTLPTQEMMAAMNAARLGDSARGDDPTVNELEQLGAALTGKDDALFVPSGTMANLAAVIAHGCHGGEVIVEASAHIFNSEGGGLSVLAGAVPRPVRGDHGVLDPDDVRAAIVERGQSALAPTKLICLENTHNASGGTVLPLENMAAIHGVAKQAGLSLHVDGARLFNAATYLGVPIVEICKHAGLGVVCAVQGAWRARRRDPRRRQRLHDARAPGGENAGRGDAPGRLDRGARHRRAEGSL